MFNSVQKENKGFFFNNPKKRNPGIKENKPRVYLNLTSFHSPSTNPPYKKV